MRGYAAWRTEAEEVKLSVLHYQERQLELGVELRARWREWRPNSGYPTLDEALRGELGISAAALRERLSYRRRKERQEPDGLEETPTTREEWLQRAIAELSGFVQAEIPPVLVSVEYCDEYWKRNRGDRKLDGRCVPLGMYEGQQYAHIFVAADLSDPKEILNTLVHELCHAALPAGTEHGKPWKKLLAAAEEKLAIALDDIISVLGDYPHEAIPLPPPRRKPIIEPEPDATSNIFDEMRNDPEVQKRASEARKEAGKDNPNSMSNQLRGLEKHIEAANFVSDAKIAAEKFMEAADQLTAHQKKDLRDSIEAVIDAWSGILSMIDSDPDEWLREATK